MGEGTGQKRRGQSWRGWGGGGGGRSSTKMEGQMSRLSRRWRWAKSHWRKWHHILSLGVSSDLPPHLTERLCKGAVGEASNAHRHVWGVLRRHGERETGAPVRTDAAACAASEGKVKRCDLHFHSEKGLESFPPSLHLLWESQAGCSYLGYQVSSRGGKVPKWTNKTAANANVAG